MKRYITIATVLAVLLLAAFTRGALAEQVGPTLEGLAEALAGLIDRTDSHEERLAAVETAIAPTPKPTATPTSAMAEPVLTIERRMNVRRGPGTNHAVLGTAETGTEFEITGRNVNGDWWQISYEDSPGWAYAPYVTASHAHDVKPVATPTALPTATTKPTNTPMPTSTPDPAALTPEEELEITASAIIGVDRLAVPWEERYEGEWRDYMDRLKPMLLTVADACGWTLDEMLPILDRHAEVLENSGYAARNNYPARASMVYALDYTENAFGLEGISCDRTLGQMVLMRLAQE